MEKKGIRLWEKILIVVLLIILLLFVIAFSRYNTLTNIEEENRQSRNKTNYYYRSETSDTIMEYWKKDEFVKVNMKKVDGDGDITFWKNTLLREEYVFYNTTKKYSKNNAGIEGTIPSSIVTSNNSDRFKLAINPSTHIGSKKYDNKECYCIKIGNQEEIIEKGTGLLLNSKNGDSERKLTYSFDTVTDEDVERPDISEYTLEE